MNQSLEHTKMEITLDTESSEARLLEALRNGDSAAFAKIVELHQGMVYRTCLRILGSDADAQDAAQATFIILHQKCRELKPGIILGGWLYRTADLVCREFVRSATRRKLREEKSMLMNETTTTTTPLMNENTPQDELWLALQPELDAALTALMPKYRDVVVLRFLEGKSTREAAEMMGISTSVVTTRVSRAMDHLRAWFQRRGVAMTAVGVTGLLAQNASAAVVPVALAPSILSATSTGGAVACSANTTLMVKGGLAKLGSASWGLTQGLLQIGFLIGDACSFFAWARGGFKFPKWVHRLAIVLFVLGVVTGVVLGVKLGSEMTFGLAAGCLLIPPAAGYLGWLMMWGPLLRTNRAKEDDK